MAKIPPTKVNIEQAGLTLGILLAIVHVFWSVLVASGNAQGAINWKLGMHFLSGNVTVLPFNLATALTLTLMAFIIGVLIGSLFALIWNWAGKHKF